MAAPSSAIASPRAETPPFVNVLEPDAAPSSRLRDSASMLTSATMHAAGLLILALLTQASTIREVTVWDATPPSDAAEATDLLDHSSELTMEVQGSTTAGAGGASFSSASDSTTAITESDLASGDLALADVGAQSSETPARGVGLSLAPRDRLLDVVAPKRPRAAPATVPAQSSLESPAAMAFAAIQGVPQWGKTDAERAVYRFILYDIGKLQGQEAADAQLAYAALPNDALPELIKGLNASAYLQASCPVIVLSSRVQNMVSASNSKEAYDYALRHIGEGVPPNAPYASHLVGLRQRLAGESGRAGGAQFAAASNARAKIIMRLNRAGAAQLSKSLASTNADERWAAARVVAARGLLLTDDLIPLLADEDPSVRVEAHTALVRLGRGVDLGPENISDDGEVEESIDLWTRWWKQNSGRPGISEYSARQDEELRLRRATNRLALAEKLLAEGHKKQARRYFEELARDFPGTPAASKAEEQLQSGGL